MTTKARGQLAVLLCLFLSLSISALAQGETALDRYVKRADPAESWEVQQSIPGLGFGTIVIRLNSQSWRHIDEAEPHIWSHWLRVVLPISVKSDTAMLVVNGGTHNSERPGAIDPALGLAAAATGIVVAELVAVPNQPIQFGDELSPRSEDAIIAYTWDKYLRDGDEEWPVQLPMVKSVTAAMDAITDFMMSIDGGQRTVNKFIVGGGSKRAWTSWLTAAVDERVVAVIPGVFDALNMQESLVNHWKLYGDWSSALSDYGELGIFAWLDSRRMNELERIVDPFAYRERLTMPKYIVNAAGDEFFPLTSSRFYYDDLEGPKYLRYVPNVSHALGDSLEGALVGGVAWAHALIAGNPIPQYSWEFTADGSIVVTTDTTPAAVKLWQATNPNVPDFRLETIGEAWTSTALAASGANVYTGSVPAPGQGWRAFFIELTYSEGFLQPVTFTSAVRVTPDTLPFNRPVVTVQAARFDPRNAPDALASAFGENFTDRTEAATTRPLPTVLAGVEVRVTDANNMVHTAKLIFASPGQINYLIPAGAAPGLAVVEVYHNGQPNTAGQLLIEPIAPGLFSADTSGEGVAAAVLLTVRPNGDQQWRLIYDEELQAAPLNIGTLEDRSYLLLFGTGMRNGEKLTAKINGIDVPVAGPAPSSEFDGLDQANVGPLPPTLNRSGETDIELSLDGIKLNVVTVNIK